MDAEEWLKQRARVRSELPEIRLAPTISHLDQGPTVFLEGVDGISITFEAVATADDGQPRLKCFDQWVVFT